MKLGVLVSAYRRSTVTRLVLQHLDGVLRDLGHGGAVRLLVGSCAEDERTATGCGWGYHTAPNKPLGAKHNAGLQALRAHAVAQDVELDAVLFCASDDLIGKTALRALIEAVEAGAPGAGLRHGTLVCATGPDRGVGLRWTGYPREPNRVLTSGRLLAKRALNALKWAPWWPSVAYPLDSGFDLRIKATPGAGLRALDTAGLVCLKVAPTRVTWDALRRLPNLRCNGAAVMRAAAHPDVLAGLNRLVASPLPEPTTLELEPWAPTLNAVPTASVHVLVTIPTIRGREAMLTRCVDALASQLGPEDAIVVHRNGSVWSAPEADPNGPAIVLVDHPDGSGPAVRFDLYGWTCKYLLALDDDLIPAPQYIERTLAALETHGPMCMLSWYARHWTKPAALLAAPENYIKRVAIRVEAELRKAVRTSYAGCGATAMHGTLLPVLLAAQRPMQYVKHDDLWLAGVMWGAGVAQVRPKGPKALLAVQGHQAGAVVLYDEAKSRGFSQRQVNVLDANARWGWRPLERTTEIPPGDQPAVVITTFDRPDLCMALLRDLVAAEARCVRVYDDASAEDYEAVQALCAEQGWRFTRAAKNHGKPRYWEWVSRIYGELRTTASDLVVQLPDDVRLCTNFFDRVRAVWAAAPDPKVAVTILRASIHEGGKSPAPGIGSSWTGRTPVDHGAVWETGWVDGCAVFSRQYLDLIDYTVKRPNRIGGQLAGAGQATRSSGVGASLSKALVNHGLYLSTQSLVRTDPDTPSLMNPTLRLAHPTRTYNFADDPPILTLTETERESRR